VKVIVRLIRRLIGIRNIFVKPALSANETAAILHRISPHTASKRTVWIISFTGVSNEPRVLRQASALIEDNWQVVVLGFDGHSKRPETWNYIRLPLSQSYSRFDYAWLRLKRVTGWLLTRTRIRWVKLAGALLYFHNIPNWRHTRNAVLDVASATTDLKPDLVICHDYFTCHAGYDLAKKFNSRFAVDCHEYSAGQYMHDPEWVSNTRPWVVEVQKYYLDKSDCITTVCDGIADLLVRDNALTKPVTVIKSVPFKDIQPYRSVDANRIIVLYHGDISYIRGLHKAIKSMQYWRSEFHLLLRGNGDSAYINDLIRIATDLGVQERLTIEAAVPFDRIVPEANRADIGYFVHKDYSPQKRFVLPNKFFEYIMAGLAICVSDLPEMARIVKSHKLGVLVPEYTEKAIADAINSLDPESINRYKQAAIHSAELLNWDYEKSRMLECYNKLYTPA